jgi:hypothetical protein
MQNPGGDRGGLHAYNRNRAVLLSAGHGRTWPLNGRVPTECNLRLTAPRDSWLEKSMGLGAAANMQDRILQRNVSAPSRVPGLCSHGR